MPSFWDATHRYFRPSFTVGCKVNIRIIVYFTSATISDSSCLMHQKTPPQLNLISRSGPMQIIFFYSRLHLDSLSAPPLNDFENFNLILASSIWHWSLSFWFREKESILPFLLEQISKFLVPQSLLSNEPVFWFVQYSGIKISRKLMSTDMSWFHHSRIFTVSTLHYITRRIFIFIFKMDTCRIYFLCMNWDFLLHLNFLVQWVATRTKYFPYDFKIGLKTMIYPPWSASCTLICCSFDFSAWVEI
jgi:hypothetical protein